MMFGKRPSAAAPSTPSANESAASSATAVLDAPAGHGEEIWTPTAARARKSVEQLLMERGQITEEQLTQARTVQSQTPGKSLAQILLTMNAASEAQILSALAETLGLPFEQPTKEQIDPQAYGLFQVDYMRKQNVVGIRFEGEKTLVVGMTDPNNVFLIDELK